MFDDVSFSDEEVEKSNRRIVEKIKQRNIRKQNSSKTAFEKGEPVLIVKTFLSKNSFQT